MKINTESEEAVTLVRVRNPWGNDVEWTGPWADGSEEWGSIPEEEKDSLGITFDNDGEWWMSFNDFCKHFDQLELCHLPPESMVEKDEAAKWFVNHWMGEWVEGESAGGCR